MYFGKAGYQVLLEHCRNMVNKFLFLSGIEWHRHVQRNRTMKTQTFNKEDCYASKRTILSLCFTKSYYFYFQWKKGGRQKVKLGMSLISSTPIAMCLKPGVFYAVPGQVYVQSSWRLILGIGWQLSVYLSVPLGPWLAANSNSSEILIAIHFSAQWIFPGWVFSCSILSCICSISRWNEADNSKQFCDNLKRNEK